MRILKKFLFDQYGGFSDKRIKNIDRGSVFIVDDRSSNDIGANKQLFSYFCMIFAKVTTEDMVEVSLHGNIPKGPKVVSLLKAQKLKVEWPYPASLKFNVTPSNLDLLSKLATAIEDIVKGGKPYPVANYKYNCPRIAASLKRLRSMLEKVWL